jgi:hypothetical protein
VTLVALAASVAAFVALLRLLNAAETGGEAVRTARAAVATLSAPGLSDAEKEAASRRAAGRLFRSFLLIAGTAAVALAVPAAIVWAGSAVGLYTLDQAVAVATGWPFLLGSTAVVVLAWILMERRR